MKNIAPILLTLACFTFFQIAQAISPPPDGGYPGGNTAEGTPQYGLIAEEVAKVNPNLVARDRNGEIMSVHYDQVNAMLLNEFLKEHREVQELQATVAQQQKQIAVLTSGLRKIDAQFELRKPGQQLAFKNHRTRFVVTRELLTGEQPC